MSTTSLLQVRSIRKSFPGVKALDGVHLDVAPGEVHALLGENGAGKSTLLKILSGAQSADEGTLLFDGEPLSPNDTPIQRRERGIVTIYQEFNLLPALTVAENMYIGREPLRHGLIQWSEMYVRAQELLSDLNIDLDPRAQVRTLSVAKQQMVEIAKAMTVQARLIVMDEPTAALSGREVSQLLDIIRDLRARGIAIIYVSHKLTEVKTICDRYTVFRDGRYVTTGSIADVSVNELCRQMIGRDVETSILGCTRRSGVGSPGRDTSKGSQWHQLHVAVEHVGERTCRRDCRLCRTGGRGSHRDGPRDLRR